MARRSYALHRWLGAIVGLQLLAWTTGGLIFATHKLAWVHGDLTRQLRPAPQLALTRIGATPEAAARAAGLGEGITSIELYQRGDRPVYEVKRGDEVALVDAETGALLPPVDRAQAEAIALADQQAAPLVSAVEYIGTSPPTEYRDKPLPAWLVSLDDGQGTHVYVDARTGAVRARRNAAWRRFDFFWMLHTMDYRGRDDFNHPLLIGAAALAVVSVASGGLLWLLRILRTWKRRRQA